MQATVALNEMAKRSGQPLAQYSSRDQVWLEGKKSPSPLSSNKARPKMVRTVQGHQRDLPSRVSASTAPIMENPQCVPCITLIAL